MPRTSKQLEQIKLKRKNKILDSSLKLFAIKGYKAVSIDDIAKASGCAHSLIYHYFPSKEEVFRQVMRNIRSIMIELIDSVDYSKKPSECLHELLKKLFDSLKIKKPDMAAIIFLVLNLHLQDEVVPQPINPDVEHRIWHVVLNLVKKGQQSGEFYDGNPEEFTIAIVTMLQGLATKAMNMDKEVFITPDPKIVMNMLLRKEQR